MFPGINLQGAVQQATNELKDTPDTLEGVQGTARKLGIDSGVVDAIYNRYGRTMQAKAVCGLLGTTPEALKADADKIIGGRSSAATPPKNVKAVGSPKFPRLK